MSPNEFPALQAALAGQYRFDRELGRGGMGVVYLATDLRLERAVAIKVLPDAHTGDAERRERFLREARTAAQLSHPHIVPIFRADELAGEAFFVMAFVDGESLAERVRDRGPLAPAEAVRWLREVAWALAYAHARGVVHRDVKPENIMIERGSGRAVVTDFGIAQAQHAKRLTLDGHVLGTVHYMSPEQVEGRTLDGRSDLYALGVVGFFALSGRLPFDGMAPSAILVAHATRPAPPLSSVAPAVPRQVAAVIDQCLAKDPDERFASGEALAEALGRALSAAEVDAAASGSGENAVISEEQAAALWRRAAQLQAEAAQRLEQRARSRDALVTRGSGATPSSGYRLSDVQSAAEEAGISRVYVQLARAEIEQAVSQVDAGKEIPTWQDRAATRLLGSGDRSLSVSRVIQAPPRRVLQAIGRVLQSVPFSLELRDTVGGHPLDGGILVFDLPPMVTMPYRWTYTRYNCYAKQVRVSVRALPNDTGSCEVTMFVDLRPGVRFNLNLGASLSTFLGGVSGVAGAAIAAKSFALAGAALALPALGIGALVGVGGVVGYGALYRWGLTRTQQELDAALAALAMDVRSEELFGMAPARLPRVTPVGGDAVYDVG